MPVPLGGMYGATPMCLCWTLLVVSLCLQEDIKKLKFTKGK